MNKFKEVRPIVLGLVKNGNKLLVSKGYDKTKKQIPKKLREKNS